MVGMWVLGGAVVVAATLVVIAAVLAEGEARVEPDRQTPVTPVDLRGARLPFAWRGYAPGHVDALLSRAATALEDAEARAPSGALPADPDTVPGFIAATLRDADGGTEAADDDPYGWAWDDPPEGPAGEPTGEESGEELEDGGRDGAGGLDR